MLQSFIVYSILGFSLFFLGKVAAIRENEYIRLNRRTPFWVWEIVLAIVIFSFVAGVRWKVGVDHLAYLKNYLSIQNFGHSLFKKEIGFEYFTRLFADFGIHYTIYFGTLAFLQIFFIYMAFRDQRFLYPFIGIIIVFGSYYLEWMNGVRQMVVACIFIFSIKYIIEKKLVKYILIILLASLFHQSALLLLPVYFIPRRNFFKNRTLALLLVFISLYLGTNNFWIESLKSTGKFLQLIGYNQFTSERLDFLIGEEQIRNFGPRRVVVILTAIITIWYSSRLDEYFEKYHFYFYFNLAILGFLLQNLLGYTHHIFLRPVSYFTIFSIATTGYLLVYLREHLTSKSIVIYLLMLLLVLIYLPLSLIADARKGREDYSNYNFFWDQSVD